MHYTNSASVIDYFVADFDLEHIVSDFEVHDRLESIHMPLRVQLTVSDIGIISNNEETQSENISVGTNCSRYYYKDDNQQEYIRTLSEQLESMFANFIELIESDLLNAA